MAMATSIVTSSLLRPRSTTSRTNALPLQSIVGGASQLSALRGCKCRALQEVQSELLRLGIEISRRARVRRSSSLNGGGVSNPEDGGSDAAMWLREQLPLQLERDGVEICASRRIGEACAYACARFLATGRAFDPMIIMDAMEEEIERRDLRGDEFLPFELSRKAAKVLTERWNALPDAERPKTYRWETFVNKKDVVDFDKWPENLNFP